MVEVIKWIKFGVPEQPQIKQCSSDLPALIVPGLQERWNNPFTYLWFYCVLIWLADLFRAPSSSAIGEFVLLIRIRALFGFVKFVCTSLQANLFPFQIWATHISPDYGIIWLRNADLEGSILHICEGPELLS